MTRFDQALILASEAHAGQIRKGTENAQGVAVPYITHPVAVAALVIRFGGDEDQAIAGLLHDVLEDGGPQWSLPILEQFGNAAWEIVCDCTDGTPDAAGKKAPWKERKTDYLGRLAGKPDASLLVCACDKLHNLQAIVADQKAIGDKVFERFTASKEETLWYYEELVDTLLAEGVPTELGNALMQSLLELRAAK